MNACWIAWRRFVTVLLLFVAMSSCARADAPPGAAPPAVHGATPEIDLGAVMRRVHFAFRPEAGGWSGGHATYAVHAGVHELEVTPRHDDAIAEPLRLSLAGIARGGVRLDGSARAAVREDGGIAITRGGVTERLENRDEGVEQSFAFAERPAGAGDLVVRMAASGQTYVGATEGGLHFTDPVAGLGVRYGLATWVDARGKKRAAKVGWDDGHVVITVPAGVVEESAYPAVLDPIVGPETEMDAPILRPTSGEGVAMAFGGGSYLVAWRDARVPLKSCIVAARISTDGVVLDPTGIVLPCSSTGNMRPAIAWNGSAWFVAWAVNKKVVGTRLSTTGVLLDPGLLTLADDAGRPGIAIASHGTGFLVAYTSDQTSPVLHYRRLGPDGAPLGAGPTIVPTPPVGPLTDFNPALAHGASGYLLAYSYAVSANEAHLAARRIAPDGALLDASEIALAATPAPPSVASDGSGWLVAWPTTAGVHALRLQADGALVDGFGGIALTTPVTPSGADLVSVVRGAADYAIFWLHALNLYGARIGSTGGVIATTGAIDSAYGGLAAASDGAGYFVSYRDGNVVHGTRLDATLAKPDPTSTLVSATANAQRRPAAAFNGTDWLVVWDDNRGPGSPNDIYGVRVSADGVVLDPNGILIAVSTNSADKHPVVSSNGSDWLVVWTVPDLRAARVSASGVVLDPVSMTIAAPTPLRKPAVASNGFDYLVTWTDGGTWGAGVSAAGVVSDPALISPGSSDFASAAVAWNGAHYLVAWLEDAVPSFIAAARVSSTGTVLDPAAIPIASTGAGPIVASDGANWLVAWGMQNVFAQRVGPGGALLDASPIPVMKTEGVTSAVWDGSQYWLSLTDGAAAPRVVRLDAAALPIDEGAIPVTTDGSYGALDPVLAAGPPKHVLVAYWGFDPLPTYGADRVRVRVISDPNGGVCAQAVECASGFCVDGVCCEDVCAGPCHACSAAKKGGGVDGVCGPIAAGTDPDDDCAADGASTCKQNGTCDGDGACAIWPAGTVCEAASCSGSAQQAASLCDGLGTCVAGAVMSCAAGDVCDPATGGCVEAGDAGTGGAPIDAGAGGPPSVAFGGCGCGAAGSSGRSAAPLAMIVLALASARRLRRGGRPRTGRERTRSSPRRARPSSDQSRMRRSQ